MDCELELSEADEICKSLDYEVVISKLDAQRLIGSVSAIKVDVNGVEVKSIPIKMEILKNPGVLEAKKEPIVVEPVEKKKNIAQDWR